MPERSFQEMKRNIIKYAFAIGTNNLASLFQNGEKERFIRFMDEGIKEGGYVVGLPLIKGGYAWFFRKIKNGFPVNPIETLSAPQDSLDCYLPPYKFAEYPTWFIKRSDIY